MLTTKLGFITAPHLRLKDPALAAFLFPTSTKDE